MSEFFKSKLGWLLAGIHLFIIFTCLLYITLINPQNVIAVLILMILTAPWGLLLMFLPGLLGISIPETLSKENQDLLLTAEFAIGGLINAFMLYLLGLLLTKVYNHFSSGKSKP